ncbi:hypothetical protein H5410_064325 [Solanum commersonii]|uniref:Uncharacterized protein n=1 Tax=Solanum commersonii TaxID=4109 RepID=A0A9J5VZW5_SOLCO|nr:hypothetical protein H5410_064325 [Solanum commersonii]
MSSMGGKSNGVRTRTMSLMQIGNGNSVKLRKDRRLNNQPLNISHPTIFRVASDPDSLVAQKREDGIRAPHFRRNMQEWELDKLIDLLSSRKSFNIPSSAR